MNINLIPSIEFPTSQSIKFDTQSFSQTSCAVQENAIGNSQSPVVFEFDSQRLTRSLLRFSVGITNAGTDDLIVGRPGCSSGSSDNCPWEWGACHRHYHFREFTHYELISRDRVAIVGRKQAFCLMDSERMDTNAPRRLARYDCSNQGISAGWADVYGWFLDGQWLDITGVEGGDYELCVTVDYSNQFEETNERDNRICEQVTLPGERSDSSSSTSSSSSSSSTSGTTSGETSEGNIGDSEFYTDTEEYDKIVGIQDNSNESNQDCVREGGPCSELFESGNCCGSSICIFGACGQPW